MTDAHGALRFLYESLTSSAIPGPRLSRIEAALSVAAKVLGTPVDHEDLTQTIEGTAAEILVDKVNQNGVEGTRVVVRGEEGHEEGVVVASVVPRLSDALDTALSTHVSNFLLDA